VGSGRGGAEDEGGGGGGGGTRGKREKETLVSLSGRIDTNTHPAGMLAGRE